MINLFNAELISEQTRIFKDIRPLWKARAAKHKITKQDLAALCIYRAMIKNEGIEGVKLRLYRSFSPITNEMKLANGAVPYGSLKSALYSIKYSCFAEWLNKEQLSLLMEVAKTIAEAGIK